MPAASAFDWSPCASPAALAQALADRVAEALREAIAARGAATLAVSGGTTPARFFSALSTHDLAWARVDVTLVDERLVPPSSPRSNERLVRENLLQRNAASARFLSFVAPPFSPAAPPHEGAEASAASAPPSPLWGGVRGGGNPAPTPEAAASAASAALALLPRPFDVVVLGMGADGHTASFFPDADRLDALLDPASTQLVLPVHAESAGEPRLTLSLPAIASARLVAVHIEGEAKRAAFEAAFSAGRPPFRPIRTVVEACRARPAVFWAPSEGSTS